MQSRPSEIMIKYNDYTYGFGIAQSKETADLWTMQIQAIIHTLVQLYGCICNCCPRERNIKCNQRSLLGLGKSIDLVGYYKREILREKQRFIWEIVDITTFNINGDDEITI